MGAKEDIDIFDSKLTQLKIDYEKYFMRIHKTEPLKLKGDVDRIVYQYHGRLISNTALKFRFNSLVSKYNSFKMYWTRVLRAIEEGKYERRAEGGGFTYQTKETGPGKKAASIEPIEELEVLGRERPATPRPTKAGNDNAALKKIYQNYLSAKKKCNESTSRLTFDAMKKGLEKQKKLMESRYGKKEIEMTVYIKDGKARIGLKPKK